MKLWTWFWYDVLPWIGLVALACTGLFCLVVAALVAESAWRAKHRRTLPPSPTSVLAAMDWDTFKHGALAEAERILKSK